jgi:hypothetical protein
MLTGDFKTAEFLLSHFLKCDQATKQAECLSRAQIALNAQCRAVRVVPEGGGK